MKTLKVILLTLLISFLLFVLSVFVIFKFVITPERINNYLENYINKKVKEQITNYDFADLGESYASNAVMNNEFDNIRKLEKFINKDLKFFDSLSDFNFVSSQLSGNINMRMDLLKYRINEYLSNKKIKEE